MIVLDTHAWVWWVSDPERIPGRARSAIDRTVGDGGRLYVSSISTWEVAMLVERGRLELTVGVADWVARSEAQPFLQFVPVDNRIALRAIALPGFVHRDPADRLIIATALVLGATVVTADQHIARYKDVKTMWVGPS